MNTFQTITSTETIGEEGRERFKKRGVREKGAEIGVTRCTNVSGYQYPMPHLGKWVSRVGQR